MGILKGSSRKEGAEETGIKKEGVIGLLCRGMCLAHCITASLDHWITGSLDG